jgi:hypothetical protein
MNARGQEEASIGDFCVQCHAPMAVRTGATTDGLNLDQLPAHLKGVTCYFCHQATGLDSTGRLHNNPLVLANDRVMRGSIRDAVVPAVHGVAYSAYHDSKRPESSVMCGACHDIMTPKGVHLERTFGEYKDSLFAASGGFESCQGCHMLPTTTTAATVMGLQTPNREVHEHLWPSVDVPLTPFPDADIMRVAVANCSLPNSVLFLLEPNTSDVGSFTVTLESNAGHNVPSGASQDRRMWLEFASYDRQGRVIQQSGVVPDGQPENFTDTGPIWAFHDRMFDEQGKEVHMFWEAAKSQQHPLGYESFTLPVAKTAVAGTHTRQRPFFLGTAPGQLSPARATFHLRMRPMAIEVLQDLVRTGHLDPKFVAAMPTFTMRSYEVVWPSGDPSDMTVTETTDKDCRRYECLLAGGTPESCGVPPAPAPTTP